MVGRNITPADYDGDGDIDIGSLAFSFGAGRLCWFENIESAENFIEREIISDVKGIQRIINADLDNDGDQDMLYSSSYLRGSIGWHINDGKGNFSENISILKKNKVRIIRSADFNNDRLNDILFATSSPLLIGWLQNLGNGQFREVLLEDSGGCQDIFCEDIDNDRDLDVLCKKKSGALSVYINIDNGNFAKEKIIAHIGFGISSIDIADIEMNGDLDIIASTKRGSVFILVNENNEHYESKNINLTDYRIGRILAFDYDGDGDIDIIASIPKYDRIIWLENLIIN